MKCILLVVAILFSFFGGAVGSFMQKDRDADEDKPGMLKVREILIVDAEGNTVGVWNEQGIVVIGTNEAKATIGPDEVKLSLGKTEPAIAFSIDKASGARGHLSAGRNSSMIEFAADPTSGAGASYRGTTGEVGVAIFSNVVEDKNTAQIAIYDVENVRRAAIGFVKDESPLVVTFDSSGNELHRLSGK